MSSTLVPSIVSVNYDGNGGVGATLDTSSADGITVAVFYGDPSTGKVLGSGSTDSEIVSFSLDDPTVLAPGDTYVAVATFGSVEKGPWGPPVTFVWQSVTLESVAIVREAVEIGWTLP